MEMWAIWLLVALALAILEIFLPGLTVICLSIGALAPCLVALAGGSQELQFIAFCVASLICFFTARPLLIAWLSRTSPEKETNANAVLGKRGWAISEIPETGERGWVKLEHEEWAAMSLHRQRILKGTEVVVMRVEGNTVMVDPCENSRNDI